MIKTIITFLRKHISYSPSAIFKEEVGKFLNIKSPSVEMTKSYEDVGIFFEIGMQLGEKEAEVEMLKGKLAIQKSIKRHYEKLIKEYKKNEL